MVAGGGITMTRASHGREAIGHHSCQGLLLTMNMNGILRRADSSIREPESRYTRGKSRYRNAKYQSLM